MEPSEWTWAERRCLWNVSVFILNSFNMGYLSTLRSSFSVLEQQPIIMNFYEWKVKAFHNNLNEASMLLLSLRIHWEENPLLPEKQAPSLLCTLFNIFPPRMSVKSRLRRKIFHHVEKMLCFLIFEGFFMLESPLFLLASLSSGWKKVEIWDSTDFVSCLTVIGSWK